MKSYPITNGQKNAIMKPQKHHGMGFNPQKDADGTWFIWKVEYDFCKINFGFELTESEFVPPEKPDLIEGIDY